MNKFILKTIVFLFPVILMVGLKYAYYTTEKGDLLRLGYLIDPKQYNRNSLFARAYALPIRYRNLSETDLSRSHQFKVLTVGDSFSEQDNSGYKNYLAQSNSVLHFDAFLHSNPIETLYGLVKGDVLDSIKVDYIILQSVERSFTYRALHIDSSKVITIEALNTTINQHKRILHASEKQQDLLFSKVPIDFTVNNIAHIFRDDALNSDVYKVNTTRKLFSVDKQDVLFYKDDLQYTGVNSEPESVMQLHLELNSLALKLKAKGIKLIVLPCPDKYDVYYPYIADQTHYPRPEFFGLLKDKKKEYLYVDTKQLLGELCKKKLDVYYYDDTHWSPIAAEVVAIEVQRKMLNP